MHLAGISWLEFLDLSNTKVTAEGVEKLRKSLLACRIDGPGIHANPDSP